MSKRERILAKIYKTLAFNPELSEQFCSSWNYIYILFQEHCENEIPDAVLEMIEGWIDTEI